MNVNIITFIILIQIVVHTRICMYICICVKGKRIEMSIYLTPYNYTSLRQPINSIATLSYNQPSETASLSHCLYSQCLYFLQWRETKIVTSQYPLLHYSKVCQLYFYIILHNY